VNQINILWLIVIMGEGEVRFVLRGLGGSIEAHVPEERLDCLRKPGAYYHGREPHWHIGFLPSEKILSYYCRKCDARYEGSPRIRVGVKKQRGMPKGIGVFVHYTCVECGQTFSKNQIQSTEGIDTEYFIRDDVFED
jgi:DNA-directed RNA polymerase subunit RPC12/RpoP